MKSHPTKSNIQKVFQDFFSSLKLTANATWKWRKLEVGRWFISFFGFMPSFRGQRYVSFREVYFLFSSGVIHSGSHFSFLHTLDSWWLVDLPPPNVPPPRNKALVNPYLQPYEPLVSLNKALTIKPLFLGVGYVGGTLGGIGWRLAMNFRDPRPLALLPQAPEGPWWVNGSSWVDFGVHFLPWESQEFPSLDVVVGS